MFPEKVWPKFTRKCAIMEQQQLKIPKEILGFVAIKGRMTDAIATPRG